jgi:hypothetical protein
MNPTNPQLSRKHRIKCAILAIVGIFHSMDIHRASTECSGGRDFWVKIATP